MHIISHVGVEIFPKPCKPVSPVLAAEARRLDIHSCVYLSFVALN